MVRAYHVILSAYGFWLPNDPRGSWSEVVRQFELRRFGPATKVTTHRSVARKPHDVQSRLAAKRTLTYPPVRFDGRQALSIAHGISRAVSDAQYTVTACAIMPDHLHLAVMRDGRTWEQIANHIKRASSRQMREDGRHPLAAFEKSNGRIPSPWARGGWGVFLDTVADIIRVNRYIENNPIRDGLRPQAWPFVSAVE